MKKWCWRSAKKDDQSDIGSGEILTCIMIVFLSIFFSFLMEYGLLMEKAELFKENLGTILEDALKKEATENIYELRRDTWAFGETQTIRDQLSAYPIEDLSIVFLEESGYCVSGTLKLDFMFGGKVAFTAKIPFRAQKVYRQIEEDAENSK